METVALQVETKDPRVYSTALLHESVDRLLTRSVTDSRSQHGVDSNYRSVLEKRTMTPSLQGSINYRVVNHSTRRELGELLSLGWPIALFLSSQILYSLIALTIMGNKNSSEFAAIAYADTWMSLTQVFIRATWLPLQTLVKNSYVRQEYSQCGVWYQVSVIIGILVGLPVVALFYFSSFWLEILAQDTSESRQTEFYLRWMCCVLPAIVLFGAERNYFAGQKVVKPAAIINFIGAVCCGIFAYRTCFSGKSQLEKRHSNVYQLDCIIMANLGAYWLVFFVFHIYSFYYMKYQTWKGTWVPWRCSNFTRDRIGRVLIFVIPNMIAVILETWSIQIISLFAGHMGLKEMANMRFAANLALLVQGLPQGLGLATHIRIENHLHYGEPSAARHTAVTTMATSIFYGLSCVAILIFLKEYIAWVMTYDEEYRDMFYDLIPYLAPVIFMNSINPPLAKILMAQGRAGTMAVIVLITRWCINIPCSYTFGYSLGWGLNGLWVGIVIGYSISALFLGIIVWRSDWVALSFEAQLKNETTPSVSLSNRI